MFISWHGSEIVVPRIPVQVHVALRVSACVCLWGLSSLTAPGLRCCAQAFSGGGARAALLSRGPCGSRALGCVRVGRCSTWAPVLCELSCYGRWSLPRVGIEPVSPALAGGFLTTVPPGKSRFPFLEVKPVIQRLWFSSLNFKHLSMKLWQLDGRTCVCVCSFFVFAFWSFFFFFLLIK